MVELTRLECNIKIINYCIATLKHLIENYEHKIDLRSSIVIKEMLQNAINEMEICIEEL